MTSAHSEVVPRASARSRELDGAMMVHEVRNMLALVRGWVELARDGDPALTARAWPVIEDGLARATSLLEAAARLDAAAPSTSARSLARRRLLEATCVARSIELRREIRSVDAQGDPEKVAQIALNLGLNAVQAIDRDGSITLRVEGDAERAWLRVVDDGPGMTEAVRARLFDPFFSTRSSPDGPARGIGLAVSQAMARSMGGRLDASSEVGAGSVMTLTLQTSHRPRPFSDVPSSELKLRPGLRVLVLDDEAAIRELLDVALSLRGVRVRCCDDIAVARAAATQGEVDIALVDESLGALGSGSALLAELAITAPRVGRVLMTGLSDASGLTAVAGAQLVRKPFLLEDILRALSEADPR
ncbi:MAG: ATP-binding protein [Polyangiales bacterium]